LVGERPARLFGRLRDGGLGLLLLAARRLGRLLGLAGAGGEIDLVGAQGRELAVHESEDDPLAVDLVGPLELEARTVLRHQPVGPRREPEDRAEQEGEDRAPSLRNVHSQCSFQFCSRTQIGIGAMQTSWVSTWNVLISCVKAVNLQPFGNVERKVLTVSAVGRQTAPVGGGVRVPVTRGFLLKLVSTNGFVTKALIVRLRSAAVVPRTGLALVERTV